jgi:hypothetical protein
MYPIMNGDTTGRLEQKYLYLGVGIIGFLVTVLLVTPGTYTAGAGPLRFDAYYASVSGFLFLAAFSLYHVYTDRAG